MPSYSVPNQPLTPQKSNGPSLTPAAHYWVFGHMCIEGICGQVSISTLHWHPDWQSINILLNTQSTSQSILNCHFNRHSVNILTLNRQLIGSQSTLGWVFTDSCIKWLSAKMLIECWSIVTQGVDGVSVRCQSRVHQGNHLRTSNNTLPWMPLYCRHDLVLSGLPG